MQPDLPWNVAGIPSEAREAARASARREGLSVGEWLTRRILASLAEGSDNNFEANARSWRAETASARESEDMLAHVSRSESEAQNAYRRIEEQLRVLSRRLDAAERSQSENGRAMSKAATEISIASREQAQAFDQLGTHVVTLSDRLKRVESHAASDGLRDAVKALHQGLSRLADQIGTTANQSASQIAAVAGNVETVAGKLAQARIESENTAHALDQRVRTIEESETVAKLSAAVEQLNARFAATQTETSGAIAKLEEKLSHVEAQMPDASLGSRVQGVEHAMVDATARLEHVERRAAANAAWEETLRILNARLEESEKRQRESAAELQVAIKEVLGRAEPAPKAAAPEAPPQYTPPPQFAPPPPPMAAPAPVATFDLPPFPEQAPPLAAAETFAAAPAFAEAPASFAPSEPFAEPPPPPFDTAPADMRFGGDASGESYLSAARRSAREAAAAQAEVKGQGFNWSFARPVDTAPAKSGGTRYVLIGGIVAIAVAAMIAGLWLSRGQQPRTMPQNIGAMFSKPTVKPLAHSATPQAQTVPPLKTVAVNSEPAVKRIDVPATPAVKTAPPVKAATLTPAQHLAALANGGNASAELLLGLKYLNGDGTQVNEAEAARWFDRAAKQGDAIAEYRLGTLYERGRGVPADAKKAAEWYAAAAKQGNRKAMHNLAVAYAQGSGVAKDYAQAAQWFSKAANLGLSDSQFNLAVLYERGMGVPQSLLDAYKWYAVAASQGDAESKSRIDALATQLSPDDRAAAQRSADSFKPAALNASANTPPDLSALPPA